jgi:hypothetical protein
VPAGVPAPHLAHVRVVIGAGHDPSGVCYGVAEFFASGGPLMARASVRVRTESTHILFILSVRFIRFALWAGEASKNAIIGIEAGCRSVTRSL